MAKDDKDRPGGPEDGEEDDSLEAIAARAMMEDAPPRQPDRGADGKRPPPRRRLVAGAEAVDQILNAGPTGRRESGQSNDAATRPRDPEAAARRAAPERPAPPPNRPHPEGRLARPAKGGAANKAPVTRPDPAKPTGAAEPTRGESRPVDAPRPLSPPAPMPTARDEGPDPSDTPFDFEIPAAPSGNGDPRDLLSGGTFEPPEPFRDSAAERSDERGRTNAADDDDTAYADDDPLDGPGWDTSPFEPETRTSAADDTLVTDGEAAPEAGGPEADAPHEERPGAETESEDLAAAAERAGLGDGRPSGVDQATGAADGDTDGAGDLLNPKEAKGATRRDDAGATDPAAGRGERDLLSEQSLKDYLEALSAGAAHNEAPPEPPREPATADAARPPGADKADEDRPAGDDGEGADGDRGDGDAASTEEAKAEQARKNWHIKPSPGTKDDPLLGSLTILCTLLDRNISAEGLTAGLPLVDGMLTPELFVRAAQRAGVSARLVRRPLEGIGKLALPCVLLLDGQRACVLTHVKRAEGKATIILPEMGAGAREVSYDELAQDYVGYALFARPEFQYDQRAEETRVADPKGWFWGTIFGSWKLYVEVIIAAIMINAFVIANPLFVMNVYDRVVPNFAEETLAVLAIGIIVVYLFDFILKLLRAYLVDVAGKTSDTQIAARLFQQMMGMKMANRPPSAGGLANQLREFEHLREFFTSSTMTTLIDFPFIFLFLAIISVIGTWKIVVIPAFIVFVTIGVGMLMQIPMQRVVRETHRESQQKNAILIEAISGIETIKATGSEGRMQRAWETFVDKTARSAMLAQRWSSAAMTFSGSMMQVVTVAVVVVGVYEIQEGNMSVGALVACTILSGRALAPLGQIAGIATRFHQSRQALQALDGMMKTPVERPEGRTFVTRPSFNGNIEFKNVAFTYPEAKTQALNDVSFKIEAGEKVGVIGRIGSGKSTLERLILGLYDPDDGAVLIDGTDTRQVDPADLRRAIGVVPQDVYLFWGTVRENIALGAPYADDQTILRAARIAGVDEFIQRHPLGLDMPVGERGMSLSGGQRQAISVARALLLDPPMLVLDEPTSAMDNTTEARFKARLGTMLANKTLILVTHRGSLLTLVDRLIVMDGGRVVADGPKDIVMEALNAGRIQTART